MASAKKKRRGKAGIKKHAVKNLTRGGLKRLLLFSGIGLGLCLLTAAVLYLNRPRLLWHVDENFTSAWNRVLRDAPPPISRFEIIPRSGNDPFPAGRFGFTVSRHGPQGYRVNGAPVVLYRDLARTRIYDNWHAIALDPWMVFRKHFDPEPTRSFLDLSNERGSLLLPGADRRAVQAWVLQLMQERPGVFAQGHEHWEEKANALIRDYPFQGGAFSYHWVQVWPMVFRTTVTCIYAPLSQARALPAFRAGLLDATRFPEPVGWDRYGMQADILWAQIRGNERQRRRIAEVESWLRNPRTQTVIANAIEWIPAHPSGIPFNTVSWATQMAWLRSSFIWQGADDALDS